MNSIPEQSKRKPKFLIQPINDTDKSWIINASTDFWGSNQVVSRGKIYDINQLPGFIAVYKSSRSGFITFHIENCECEITSLLSLVQGAGIGTQLIEAVKLMPAVQECKRIWLITTNDNTPGLRFYQKYGFSLKAIYTNAIKEARRLKPTIPEFGSDGIPIRDEIELELIL